MGRALGLPSRGRIAVGPAAALGHLALYIANPIAVGVVGFREHLPAWAIWPSVQISIAVSSGLIMIGLALYTV